MLKNRLLTFSALLSLFLMSLFMGVQTPPSIFAESPTVIYFYESLCTGCQELDRLGVVEDLEAAGVDVQIKNLSLDENLRLFSIYSDTYGIPQRQRNTPLMFAGSRYFSGVETIVEALADGSMVRAANDPLLELQEDLLDLTGFSGLMRIVVAGLLDSVNPCAIAMLLMFIGLVGKLNKPALIKRVSFAYIFGIFITYFLIGVFLLGLMRQFAAQINLAQAIIYILFGLLSVFLAVITFYDFIVTRRHEYGKVKNQLPKIIKKFNERFMDRFLAGLADDDASIKTKFMTFLVPFFIGVVVAFTEAACTGQVYGLILLSIRSAEPVTGIIYLLIFNTLFISPLLIISAIAIKNRSTQSIAMFVQSKLPIIKLATALFFTAMAVYFFINAG